MTFLHEQPDFGDLLAVVGDNLKIDPGLVEKDYWLMHSLWGLQHLGEPVAVGMGDREAVAVGILRASGPYVPSLLRTSKWLPFERLEKSRPSPPGTL